MESNLEPVAQAVSLIVVRQLPIIEEQLKSIKPQIVARVAAILAMPCTDETVKEVKKERAKLNGDLAILEEQRKAAKNEVMAPYNHFEEVYKDCVSAPFKEADAKLKERIDAVERQLKAEKETDLRLYFDEYAISKGLDWIKFTQANLNVTLSASAKQLREEIKSFIDATADAIAMIEEHPYRDEVMVEYKTTLNAPSAIITVSNRHKKIEEEQAAAQARTATQGAQAITPVEAIIDAAESAPQRLATNPDAPTFTAKFTVTATIEKLRELKQFMIERGITYEQSNN